MFCRSLFRKRFDQSIYRNLPELDGIHRSSDRGLGFRVPKLSRYLLYRALGALVPYIVGTWGVRGLGNNRLVPVRDR